MTDIVTRTASVIEQVVVGGDLSKLTSEQRVNYYNEVCKSLGINPLTRPFQYLTLNGRMVLYASRDATDQLRKIHGVKVRITSREKIDDIYVVTAMAETPDGRTDESIGAVAIGNIKGDALANALMKAETKAKRRCTLSIVGLGWLDETEIDTIPDARPMTVSMDTGEFVRPTPQVEAPKATNGGAKPPLRAMADRIFTCSDCKQPITEAEIGGQPRTPEFIATASMRRFKRMLCADCAKAEEADRAARLAAEEAEQSAFASAEA